jgi:uncharacterized membrane protein
MFTINTSAFKSYGLWTAIAAFVLLILQQVFQVPINVSVYNQVITGFLSILVVVGIVSSPPPSQDQQANRIAAKVIATLRAPASISVSGSAYVGEQFLKQSAKTYDSATDPGAIRSGTAQPLS